MITHYIFLAHDTTLQKENSCSIH